MKFAKEDLLLYAVTDRSWLKGKTLYEQVEQALQGGATFLQLREKELDEAHFMEEAAEIQKLCSQYQVPFLINDNVDIALAMGADGVHVGQEDMEAGEARRKLGPDKIIGVSAHSVEEALRAEVCGADYLGVGAVFSTTSKSNVRELPYETLKAICEAVHIPVVAIGGIGKENIMQLEGSGICGVAVISAIFAQPDITAAARELLTLSGKVTGRVKIEGAVFDMDGTLLDTMPIWEHATENYLVGKGIEVKEKLSETLFTMSMKQGAAYVKEKYGLSESIEELIAATNAIVAEAYRNRAEAKPGVPEFLEKLKQRGVKMVVATSTDRVHAEAALKRTGIYDYFERIFTCSEVGEGKSKPDIYEEAAAELGTKRTATWVFEDALYAIKTAKKAGFRTVGLYDETSKKEQEKIRGTADIYLKEIEEFPLEIEETKNQIRSAGK